MGSNDPSRLICQIFQRSQDGELGKCVRKLRKVYDEERTDKDKFFEKFVFFLQLPLTWEEKTPFVDNALEMACRFACSFMPEDKKKEDEAGDKSGNNDEDDELIELPPFMNKIFNWLLDHHEVSGSMARYRICTMINRLLKLMGEDASIDDELYEKIYDNMLARANDKVSGIRSQAIMALQRLQDPKNEDCPIMKSFFFHMANDPSPVVRRTVIRCIGATRMTLPHILKRTKDVDENVRRTAYHFIAHKIHIKSFTIAQREQVLKRGLGDRSEHVRKVVEKDLVSSWLRLCNDSIVELLYALDVGNSDGVTAVNMLKVLFKDIPFQELVQNFQYIGEGRVVPMGKLSAETSIYWCQLALFLHTEGGGALTQLDTIVPELTEFCNYLRNFILETERSEDDVSWHFVAKQLITMLDVFDLADEHGRSRLVSLLRDLFSSKVITTDFVKPLMKVYNVAEVSSDSRIRDLAQIIADLRDQSDENEIIETSRVAAKDPSIVAETPVRGGIYDEDEQRKRKVEIAKVRVQLNILQQDLEDAIQNKDFMKAQDIKIQMDKLDEEKNKLQDELTEATAMTPADHGIKPVESGILPEETKVEEPEPKKDDPAVTHKCLEMIYELMQDSNIKTLNPILLTLLEEFIIPSFRDIEYLIRQSAVKALGVCALRNLDIARKHLILILQVANLDMVEVRITALSIINDLLLWHGLPAFISNEKQDDENKSNAGSVPESDIVDIYKEGQRLTQLDLETQGGHSVVAQLCHFLDDPNLELRTKVAEGMCKLLMVGSIQSAKLFTRLILMWYNPLMDTDAKLRNILGTFFPLYSSISGSNQDSIEEAFFPTMKLLFNAPPTSPLAEIDFEDVGMFFVNLTRSDMLQRKDNVNNVHDSMAISLCNEILKKPDSYHNKLLMKLLTNLQITPTNFVNLRELSVLITQMKASVKEKLLIKSIEKYDNFVTTLLTKDPGFDDSVAAEPSTLVEPAEPNDPYNKIDSATSADDDSSINSTKMGSKRKLFSQTTMMSPVEEKDENLMPPPESKQPSTSDLSQDEAAKGSQEFFVLRVEETSSEDEEIFISGSDVTIQKTAIAESTDESDDKKGEKEKEKTKKKVVEESTDSDDKTNGKESTDDSREAKSKRGKSKQKKKTFVEESDDSEGTIVKDSTEESEKTVVDESTDDSEDLFGDSPKKKPTTRRSRSSTKRTTTNTRTSEDPTLEEFFDVPSSTQKSSSSLNSSPRVVLRRLSPRKISSSSTSVYQTPKSSLSSNSEPSRRSSRKTTKKADLEGPKKSKKKSSSSPMNSPPKKISRSSSKSKKFLTVSSDADSEKSSQSTRSSRRSRTSELSDVFESTPSPARRSARKTKSKLSLKKK